MSLFNLMKPVDIDIELNGCDFRKMVEFGVEDGKRERHYLYYDGEAVSGKVNITFRRPGTRLDHQGIKIEFIGQIDLHFDRSSRSEFISLVRELARPGELCSSRSFDFEFAHVEKPYESYSGSNVRLQYFLRVTIVKWLSDIVKELPLAVRTVSPYSTTNCSIKMEVGIEDALHIEFEYNKSRYHLNDVVVGKIHFLFVGLKITHMEVQLLRNEVVGSGGNGLTESEVIAKYEIMDGLPVRGESVPIRLFLSGYELTPTMCDINKKFSVRYYLNLVLLDEDDRRYFKQHEITLYRRVDRHHHNLLVSQSIANNSSTSASPVCASEDIIPSRSSPSKSLSD